MQLYTNKSISDVNMLSEVEKLLHLKLFQNISQYSKQFKIESILHRIFFLSIPKRYSNIVDLARDSILSVSRKQNMLS